MAVGRYGTPEAVVLNQAPLMNFFLQQQQEKKAQAQLLDRQINEDMTKLSFDGARSQDYSTIRGGYDAFKNAAIQYKKALRDPKRRDAAEQEYLNSKAQLNALISQSKEAKERTKQIYDFYGKNRDQINEDEFRGSIGKLNAPIGTPQYEEAKQYDIGSIIFRPEQFDTNKWQDVISAVKPTEVTTPTTLPNGQIETRKKRVIDPMALSQVVAQAYEADYGRAKKFYNTQFSSLLPEDKQLYEDYARRYIPNFEIKTPKELAIAANMYGRIEQDLGRDIKGTDLNRREAFAREQQNRQIAAANARQQKELSARQKKEDYYVEDDIAANLVAGERDNVIAPFESMASPGTVVTYVRDNDGINDKGRIDRIYEDMKKNGVAAKTRLMKRSQLGAGAIIVAVPKINPETKEVVPGKYEYMAVSSQQNGLQTRINALLNYAKGGTSKPLPSKYYKGWITPPTTQEPDVIYEPGSLYEPEDNE
jgi:hypothetical protein